MANIPVQKFSEEKSLPAVWSDEIQEFSERLRRKAFELFQRGGCADGHDIDHWLEAEKELSSVLRLELTETGDEFRLRMAVPGFDAKEIEVSALPDALLVKAQGNYQREKKESEVCYTEFSDESLFRRVPLAQSIDVDRVTAQLDKGILSVAAHKITEHKGNEKNASVAGA